MSQLLGARSWARCDSRATPSRQEPRPNGLSRLPAGTRARRLARCVFPRWCRTLGAPDPAHGLQVIVCNQMPRIVPGSLLPRHPAHPCRHRLPSQMAGACRKRGERGGAGP